MAVLITPGGVDERPASFVEDREDFLGAQRGNPVIAIGGAEPLPVFGRRSWNSYRVASHSNSLPKRSDRDLGDHELITLVGLLFECANGLEQRVRENMRRDSDMAASTFEVLIRLLRSPGHRSRLADLGQELAITTGGVTRLMDRMEEQGMVRRVRSRTDRRAIYAVLTASGRRAVMAALPAHVLDLEDAFAVLSLRQRRRLEDCLRALRPAACGSSYRGVTPPGI